MGEAPVVDQKDELALALTQVVACQGLKWGDQLGQAGAGVGEEPPGGLGLGLGRLVRQGFGGGGERVGTALVLLDQQRVTPLQPFVQIGK